MACLDILFLGEERFLCYIYYGFRVVLHVLVSCLDFRRRRGDNSCSTTSDKKAVQVEPRTERNKLAKEKMSGRTFDLTETKRMTIQDKLRMISIAQTVIKHENAVFGIAIRVSF